MSIVFDNLSSAEHKHIPYAVILIQCLEAWRLNVINLDLTILFYSTMEPYQHHLPKRLNSRLGSKNSHETFNKKLLVLMKQRPSFTKRTIS